MYNQKLFANTACSKKGIESFYLNLHKMSLIFLVNLKVLAR